MISARLFEGDAENNYSTGNMPRLALQYIGISIGVATSFIETFYQTLTGFGLFYAHQSAIGSGLDDRCDCLMGIVNVISGEKHTIVPSLGLFDPTALRIATSQIIKINSVLPINKNFLSTSTQEPVKIEKTINSVQLLGRVGADPQKKGSNDHPVAIFSLATHSNYRYETGEFLQRTEWHRVICFKPGLRETILNYLKKGQRVHVTGRITYGEVTGEDGKVRNTTAIAADDVIFFQSQ